MEDGRRHLKADRTAYYRSACSTSFLGRCFGRERSIRAQHVLDRSLGALSSATSVEQASPPSGPVLSGLITDEMRTCETLRIGGRKPMLGRGNAIGGWVDHRILLGSAVARGEGCYAGNHAAIMGTGQPGVST